MESRLLNSSDRLRTAAQQQRFFQELQKSSPRVGGSNLTARPQKFLALRRHGGERASSHSPTTVYICCNQRRTESI